MGNHENYHITFLRFFINVCFKRLYGGIKNFIYSDDKGIVYVILILIAALGGFIANKCSSSGAVSYQTNINNYYEIEKEMDAALQRFFVNREKTQIQPIKIDDKNDNKQINGAGVHTSDKGKEYDTQSTQNSLINFHEINTDNSQKNDVKQKIIPKSSDGSLVGSNAKDDGQKKESFSGKQMDHGQKKFFDERFSIPH